MKSKYHTRPLIALALFSAASMAAVSAQDAPANQPVAPAPPSEEATKIQAEWLEVHGKLQEAEQKAAVQPKVIAEREKLNVMLEETLIEKEPEMEPKIKDSKALLEKIRENPELEKPQQEQSPEFVEEVKKFQSLETELSVKRNEIVTTDPEVQTQYKTLEKTMINEMTKIEPETPLLIAKRESLAKQFQQLQQ